MSERLVDIEDIGNQDDGSDEERRKDIEVIKKNFQRKQKQNKAYDKSQDAASKNAVPGTQKIYVKTFGCSHNVSDSEYMMGQLVEYGYQLVDDPMEADCLLINSCTVKNPSQENLMR